MTKIKKFKAIESTMTQKHRAVCSKRDFKSAWFSDIQKAETEALKHQSNNKTHVVHIETEFKQKTYSYL